ncbi:MAG TPA: ACP S-malonyltransferase [Thermoleophilia bacterium]|nr:ACP S-malonyltransferase [Thermoleophilia bacterium]HQG03105.1 ACP S-malonyltransferase [Thermoleophilia bacterium]HQG54405.1 ACP S-malonyltransferase [Thermoleophilia bacterium]HQJ97346.1 ACP S-malonyltransferase [Thermoleophilia bacterium]
MKKVVLMFPGQGSQAVGMGCDLAAADPLMRETFAEASEVLGYDLARLCAAGPAEILDRTDHTQPALLVVSVGIFRILRREGLCFAAAIGHSLGDYSALVATGALDLRTAVRVVRRRGEEMLAAAERAPGGMAAVIGLPDDVVDELCAGIDGVWPANYNAPGQVVVSGTRGGLDALTQGAAAVGAKKVVPLAVSGAFHTPLMEAALVPLRAELEAVDWRSPDPPFFSATSLRFERTDLAGLLARQLVSPVRFAPAVSMMWAAGYDSYLEVGSGSVLSGLVRRIAPQAAVARASDVATVTSLIEEGWYVEAP